MKTRNQFIILSALCFIATVFFFSCNKEDDKKGEGELIIMENSADPLLFTYLSGSEDMIYDYYGTRDNTGQPSKIEQIFVRQNDSILQRFYYDELGRPLKMISNNGEVNLEWISKSEFILSMISKDGKNQFISEVNSDTANEVNSHIGTDGLHATTRSKTDIRNGKKISLKTTHSTPVAYQSQLNSTKSSNSNCKIFVTRCGELDNQATVYVKATTGYPEYKFLGAFPAKRTGNGIYETTIPDGTAPSINPNEVCHKIENVISTMCDYYDPFIVESICATVSFGLAMGVITAGASPIFFTLCSEFNIVASFVCYSPSGGGPSIFDRVMEMLQVCDVVFENRTYYQDIVLYPKVSGIPNDILGSPEVVPGNGPYPSLFVEISDKTHVRPLTLTPSRPYEDQDYLATVEIYCIKPGTNISLSIKGTDGYEDEVSYNVWETRPESSFKLLVPGAEKGVRDIITLKVKLPNGEILTQTSSLVFQ